MNYTEMLLILALAAAVFFSVRSVVKNRKSGSCCGSCSGCAGCQDHNNQQ